MELRDFVLKNGYTEESELRIEPKANGFGLVKMDALAIDRAIARIAHEILERNKEQEKVSQYPKRGFSPV